MPPRIVYVIAGPNGAGKTTFAREFLPKYAHCENFVNADLIAQGISPLAPEKAAFHAGRLMLREIDRLAESGASFAFETTLSGQTQVGLWQDLKAAGYQIHLFFLWLRSADLAAFRVQVRVQEGGHDVPASVLRRRYKRSFDIFLRIYRHESSFWMLFDNSEAAAVRVASSKAGNLHIIDRARYFRIFRANDE